MKYSAQGNERYPVYDAIRELGRRFIVIILSWPPPFSCSCKFFNNSHAGAIPKKPAFRAFGDGPILFLSLSKIQIFFFFAKKVRKARENFLSRVSKQEEIVCNDRRHLLTVVGSLGAWRAKHHELSTAYLRW